MRKGGCLQEFKDLLPLKNCIQKSLCRIRINYRQPNRQIQVLGKRPDSACFRKLDEFSLPNVFIKINRSLTKQNAKKLIIYKFSLAKRLFDLDGDSSGASNKAIIYISSSEVELSDGWELDCSTDSEEIVASIEREVCSSRMLIDGRIMTVEEEQEEMTPGPSTSNLCGEVTPASKLGHKYFDPAMCHAPQTKWEIKDWNLQDTFASSRLAHVSAAT